MLKILIGNESYHNFLSFYQGHWDYVEVLFLIRSTLIDTVLCISVGPRPHGLQTREIIKIMTDPCKPINFDVFSWELSKKKNSKWPT